MRRYARMKTTLAALQMTDIMAKLKARQLRGTTVKIQTGNNKHMNQDNRCGDEKEDADLGDNQEVKNKQAVAFNQMVEEEEREATSDSYVSAVYQRGDEDVPEAQVGIGGW